MFCSVLFCCCLDGDWKKKMSVIRHHELHNGEYEYEYEYENGEFSPSTIQ